MTRPRLLLGCLGLAGAIVVSILWIDRPLARAFAVFRLGHEVFSSSTVTQPVMLALAYAGLALGLGFLATGRRLPRWVEAAMLAGIALLAGLWLTHEVLKPIFGRTLPSYYLRTGRHGFHWFQGSARGAFPSGHSVQASAMLTVLWVYYPRWRWLCIVAMAVLAVALMLGQWHYLSDIMAGTGVGVATASAAIGLWHAARRRWRFLGA